MAQVVLLPGKEKKTALGHPWIYRTEIDRVEGAFAPGDVVDVVSGRGRFLAKAYYNPASMIALRVMTYRDEPVDGAFIAARIARAVEYRRGFADMHSCRMVFAESDFLPALIVDAFGSVLVVQFLSLGMDRFREDVVRALVDALHPTGIYERSDVPVRRLEGLPQRTGLLYGEVPDRVSFRENGLSLSVDVKNGQKTGYFLDQKENRAAIAPFVKGRRVLDCFSHVGAFALHAGMYGAQEVTGVDISAEAVAMAQEHARMNGLEDRVRFLEANCFDFLREAGERGERYGAIILDPPAFTKSRAAVPGALRGYKEINLRAMKLLEDGGYLVSCSCSHHVGPEAFQKVIGQAARDAHCILRQVEFRTQGKDHPILPASPETQYLKCAILQVFHEGR